jgi:hypothetical protein
MLFVVGKIFIREYTKFSLLKFCTSDPVDCYVYGVLAKSMNVSKAK